MAPLHSGPHLLNGIALDERGTLYVTDSLAPVIYRVGPDGNAEVLVRDERFLGEGINLNGVLVHPDGYLLVAHKSSGALFRVPLDNPGSLSDVRLEAPLPGADGLLLVGNHDVVVVANQIPGAASNAAIVLRTRDELASATELGRLGFGPVYPTTAARQGDRIYAVYSQLDTLLRSTPETRNLQQATANIVEIGRLNADRQGASVLSLTLPDR